MSSQAGLRVSRRGFDGGPFGRVRGHFFRSWAPLGRFLDEIWGIMVRRRIFEAMFSDFLYVCVDFWWICGRFGDDFWTIFSHVRQKCDFVKNSVSPR